LTRIFPAPGVHVEMKLQFFADLGVVVVAAKGPFDSRPQPHLISS